MKEAYVSYEVAKLLKDKGFDWRVFNFYDEHGRFSEHIGSVYTLYNWNYPTKDGYGSHYCCAPTQQMAVRWVWEEKGLNINAIYGDYPALKKSFWMPQIVSLEDTYGTEDEDFFREYDSREDCIEAALEYALRNLI